MAVSTPTPSRSGRATSCTAGVTRLITRAYLVGKGSTRFTGRAARVTLRGCAAAATASRGPTGGSAGGPAAAVWYATAAPATDAVTRDSVGVGPITARWAGRPFGGGVAFGHGGEADAIARALNGMKRRKRAAIVFKGHRGNKRALGGTAVVNVGPSRSPGVPVTDPAPVVTGKARATVVYVSVRGTAAGIYARGMRERSKDGARVCSSRGRRDRVAAT